MSLPPNSCRRWLNRVACSTLAAVSLVTIASAAPTGRQTLMYQGIERSYVVRLPGPGLAADRRLPLVLVLHGGAGDAATIEAATGFTDKARLEKFIVVYPEGSGRFGHKLLTWNAGHCCGHAMENKVDDTGFIRALIDRLTAEYPVDPRRIYATGISNGGMMTHRLGIELPDRIAAIAPVAAAVFGDERKPANPVSALMINGRLDTVSTTAVTHGPAHQTKVGVPRMRSGRSSRPMRSEMGDQRACGCRGLGPVALIGRIAQED